MTNKKMKSNNREQIIKDVENLMIKVLKDDIPTRDSLSKNHTLKQTNFWRGGDVSVIKNTRDIPKEEGWYPKDQYIVSNSAYEVSWVMCELRDIYMKNDFYDFDLKYVLFGTFADNYIRNFRKMKRVNKQWLQKQDSWFLEKKFILESLKDIIYSHNNSFLPCKCDPSEEESKNNPMTDLHLAAEC